MKVTAKQYANTLYELTQNKSNSEIDDIVLKLVIYMKKTGDLIKSRDVIKQFGNVYNSKNNIIEATLISARNLSDEEKKKIQSFIKMRYNAHSVIMNNVVDKNIKGGIIIKVGDEILDGSIMNKLNKLKMSLNK